MYKRQLLLFGFGLKSRYKEFSAKDHVLLDQLFFYHMIMSFVFYIYITTNGGDAMHYWNASKEFEFNDLWALFIKDFNSSPAMFLINFIPSNLLDLHFFTGCILYGLFGYWAILYILYVLKKLIPLNYHLKNFKILNFSIYPAILFLPNFHFWSAGVGKDTLSFYVVSLFFFVLLDLKRRWYILILPLAALYFIRPHIILFLVSGLGVSYLLKSRLMMFQKVFLLVVATVVFIPFLNSVLEFAKIDEASLDSFQDFSSSKAEALSRTAGSGVELSSLPYPLQVFTFLYRPLFFDAGNILGILASVENVVWLVLTINYLRNRPFLVWKNSHYFILGAFLYWLIGALAFAPSMSNLGIIIRERNMFLPAFILFALAGLANTPKFRRFEWWYQQTQHQFWSLKHQENYPGNNDNS